MLQCSPGALPMCFHPDMLRSNLAQQLHMAMLPVCWVLVALHTLLP